MIRTFPLLLALALPLAAVDARPAPALHHARGTFTSEVIPQPQQAENPAQALSLAKHFTGALTGVSLGIMAGIGQPKPGNAASYVAIERFDGKLDGRKGGFILVQRGWMDRAGHTHIDATIAADSGTGELAGITGELAIRIEHGIHNFDLAYRLPPRSR